MSSVIVTLLFLIPVTQIWGTTTYDNKSAGLTSIPVTADRQVRKIYLDGNDFTTISTTEFKDFGLLELLHMRDNKITSFSADAFKFNVFLREIDLSNNPIKTIPYFPDIDDTLKNLYLSHCEISETTWDLKVLYSNLEVLTLDNNQLRKIPDLTKPAAKLSELTLENNDISNSSGMLLLPMLRKLLIQDNMLNHLPDLSQLPMLAILNIQNNQIQAIPNNSFINNNKLAWLSIENNGLSYLPDFDGAKNSIWLLGLGRHSKVTSIPSDYFSGFTKLNTLWIRNMSVTSSAFAKSIGPSVKSISMDRCKIAVIPADTFVNVASLRKLTISNNGLTHFDMSNLKYMPELQFLELNGNNLVEVENAYKFCRGVACTSLKLRLNSNPIPCDKNMCWAKENTTITVTKDACSSGKAWNNVVLDDLDCPKSKYNSFLRLLRYRVIGVPGNLCVGGGVTFLAQKK